MTSRRGNRISFVALLFRGCSNAFVDTRAAKRGDAFRALRCYRICRRFGSRWVYANATGVCHSQHHLPVDLGVKVFLAGVLTKKPFVLGGQPTRIEIRKESPKLRVDLRRAVAALHQASDVALDASAYSLSAALEVGQSRVAGITRRDCGFRVGSLFCGRQRRAEIFVPRQHVEELHL